MPNKIPIQVHRHDEKQPKQYSVDDEITFDVLIREISPDGHEDLDIFIEGVEQPCERDHRLRDHGIKPGHHLRVRPRHHKKLIIFIDAKEYHPPKNPMTGAELKKLGGIGKGYDLWEKVPGKDDIRIEDNQVVHLRNHEHFYSAPSTLNPGSF